MSALYEMMNDAEKLTALSVRDLRQLVQQFPYFQSARKLLLRKLHDEDAEGFEQELKQSSIYIGDRAKLYFYLNDGLSQRITAVDQSLPDLSLITTHSASDNVSISDEKSGESTFNYLFLSEDEARVINKEEKSRPMDSVQSEVGTGMDLIDKFMTVGGAKITPSKNNNGPVVNLAEDSVKENPAILTETLARIYIKQKKYDKAIDIFNNLSLKFPEKSAYFADRIKELDILIKSS